MGEFFIFLFITEIIRGISRLAKSEKPQFTKA